MLFFAKLERAATLAIFTISSFTSLVLAYLQFHRCSSFVAANTSRIDFVQGACLCPPCRRLPSPFRPRDSCSCSMGGCQNAGALLGPLNARCRIIIRSQTRTIILTTTNMHLCIDCCGHNQERLGELLIHELQPTLSHKGTSVGP